MSEPDILEQLRVYNESRDRMGGEADTLCVDAAEEITTLRAENELLVEAVIFGCTCSPTGMSGDRICKRCLWLEGRDDG